MFTYKNLKMKTFIAQSRDGNLFLGDQADSFREVLKKNPGMRFTIDPLLPDSRQQRKFYHGAVIPLWAYLDGKNYKDNYILDSMHELAKIEFNGEILVANGKSTRIGKTSRGKLNQGYIDRIVDYLEENYGIDRKIALNPKDYKHWRDVIFPYGGPDNYIGYLIESGKIK
jgi:hypothetical protein